MFESRYNIVIDNVSVEYTSTTTLFGDFEIEYEYIENE